VVADYASLRTVPAVAYRRDRPPPGGVGVVDGWIVAADVERLPLVGGGIASAGPDGRIMPVDELAIPGAHNVSNALAAVAVGLLFGVAPEAIRAAAVAFTGVEHRLEPVTVIDGVRFINDSQGTQPDAVIAALRAFEAPVVLIAGGRDKGVDLDELAAVVAERVAAAVLIGETAPDLERRFRDAGLDRIERASSMVEAVTRADALARAALDAVDAVDVRDAGPTRTDRPAPSRATVLLSPAATSFDMFKDYAARGRAFKSAVANLAATRAGRDR
jgi:UDP-N-acetylmuramoylalanine--D-glutamate ligase